MNVTIDRIIPRIRRAEYGRVWCLTQSVPICCHLAVAGEVMMSVGSFPAKNRRQRPRFLKAMYYSLEIRGQTVPLIYSTNSWRYYHRDAIAKLLYRQWRAGQKSSNIARVFVGLYPC